MLNKLNSPVDVTYDDAVPFDIVLDCPRSRSETSYGGLFLICSLTSVRSILVYKVLVLLYLCLVFCIYPSKEIRIVQKNYSLLLDHHAMMANVSY